MSEQHEQMQALAEGLLGPQGSVLGGAVKHMTTQSVRALLESLQYLGIVEYHDVEHGRACASTPHYHFTEQQVSGEIMGRILREAAAGRPWRP